MPVTAENGRYCWGALSELRDKPGLDGEGSRRFVYRFKQIFKCGDCICSSTCLLSSSSIENLEELLVTPKAYQNPCSLAPGSGLLPGLIVFASHVAARCGTEEGHGRDTFPPLQHETATMDEHDDNMNVHAW